MVRRLQEVGVIARIIICAVCGFLKIGNSLRNSQEQSSLVKLSTSCAAPTKFIGISKVTGRSAIKPLRIS
jgi:hypothetical protein